MPSLYFTPEQIKAAHDSVNREPIQTAWMYLSTQPLDDTITNDTDLSLHAFRYVFSDNQDSGELVVRTLQSGYGMNLDSYPSYFDALASAIAIAEAAELVSEHPAF